MLITNPPLEHVLGQAMPVHFIPSFFFRLYFNIIIQPKLASREWSPPFRFPNQNFVCIYRLSHNLNQRVTPFLT